MRLLTWNLNRRPPEPTWAYVDSVFRPDVAFVQEAVKPPDVVEFSPDRWMWEEIGDNSRFGAAGKYGWATGIYARSGGLKPLRFPSLGPGWVVGATLTFQGRQLTLINVHVELDKDDGYATTTLARIISELGDMVRGPDVIFGGDLNVDRLLDEVYGGRRHSEILSRLEKQGLFHVNSRLPKGTRTNAMSKHPYQIDHFFVSESLRESIEDVQVVAGSRIRSLSDHFPVLLDLNL